jgi:hypothetical protein
MSESSKNINELLRSIDKVVKTGNLEEASVLVERILEINPKNTYARAYKERISTLIIEKKEKEASTTSQISNQQPRPTAVSPLPEKAEPIQSIQTENYLTQFLKRIKHY